MAVWKRLQADVFARRRLLVRPDGWRRQVGLDSVLGSRKATYLTHSRAHEPADRPALVGTVALPEAAPIDVLRGAAEVCRIFHWLCQSVQKGCTAECETGRQTQRICSSQHRSASPSWCTRERLAHRKCNRQEASPAEISYSPHIVGLVFKADHTFTKLNFDFVRLRDQFFRKLSEMVYKRDVDRDAVLHEVWESREGYSRDQFFRKLSEMGSVRVKWLPARQRMRAAAEAAAAAVVERRSGQREHVHVSPDSIERQFASRSPP